MKKIIVALAAVALMATSAYAAEWNFYGSASVQTFWVDSDPLLGADTADTAVTMGNIDSANVIGANVTVSDELTARFEYGNDNTAGGGTGNVNLRHLYGTWNFGAGSLVIGQTDGAFDTDIGNQVYNDGLIGSIGCADTGRAPLIMLIFGGLKVNIEAPVAGIYDPTGTGGAAALTTTEAEATLPQFNVSYTLNFDNIAVELGGAYQTYEYTSIGAPANVTVDVDSYVVGAQFTGTFGAFGLKASLFTGQNAANLIGVDSGSLAYGITATTSSHGYAYYDGTNDTVRDSESFGYAVSASYVMNDMFAFGAGYGTVENELDVPNSGDDEGNVYYINMPITLAPGVTVTPEIGKIDYNEAVATETESTYFGAAWKISF